MTLRRALFAPLLPFALLLFSAGAGATAPATADLTVQSLVALSPTPVQGGTLSVAAVIRNAGRRPAPRSIVRFYLSRDGLRSRDDVSLAGQARIPSLRPHVGAAVEARLAVPGSVRPGAWFVLACADATGRVRERTERNNCPRSADRVGVQSPAQPVIIQPRLHEALRVSKPVGPAGGTVSTLGPDGTAYFLVFPEGSLPAARRITMTPLAGASGLPLSGGLVAGVQLEPDGLELAKPASLVIVREGLSASPDQVAFGWHGTGSGFHLTPFAQRPPPDLPFDPAQALVVPVFHFSGEGVGSGTIADLAAQVNRSATETADRLNQETAAQLHDERACQSAGGAPGCSGKTAQELTRQPLIDYVDSVLLPKASAAEWSDELLIDAQAELDGWERQIEFLGHDALRAELAAKIAEVERLINKAWAKAFARAAEACRRGDPSAARRLVTIARLRALRGREKYAQQLGELISKCASLTLEVRSKIEVHSSHPELGTVDTVVELQAAVPLLVDNNNGLVSGSGRWVYTQASHSVDVRLAIPPYLSVHRQERFTGNVIPGTLTIPASSLYFHFGDTDAADEVRHLNLLVDPGRPQEEIAYTDEGEVIAGGYHTESGTELETNWLEWWTSFHLDDATASEGLWLIDGFEPVAGDGTLARKTFTAARREGSISETWEIVRKRPGTG